MLQGFEPFLFRVIFITMALSFVTVLLIGPKLISWLRVLKFGQEVRDDGPQSHLKKQGTPTMGGVMFILAAAFASLLGFIKVGGSRPDAFAVLLLFLGFGTVGFLDDYTKIKKKNSKGLSPALKLLLQFAFTVGFAFFVYHEKAVDGAVKVYIPFTGCGETAKFWYMPMWLYIVFVLFVVLGTDNGVNFTDGLDGLCASVTCITAAFFMIIGAVVSPDLSVVSAAILGGLMGYLVFNVYPAKVFMGDTGSLALGGFVAGAAVVTGTELYIPVIGIIYLVEVLSVIIQVSVFKYTRIKTGEGRRVFRMAPLHHHFELSGNSETRIVAVFTIVTVLVCGLGLVGFMFVR